MSAARSRIIAAMFEWWDEDVPAGGPLPADGVLGVVLRAARYDKVLSQKELAARSGVTQSVISRMERGARTNWQVFCRLLDAMDLEPVVTTRRRTADLDREVKRLATMTAIDRLVERDLFLEWLPKDLPASGWALDGDAALLAHGVPASPSRFTIAVLPELADHPVVARLRDDWQAPFEFHVVSELSQLLHLEVGERNVGLLPLDRPSGSRRSDFRVGEVGAATCSVV
jgi:transcriptional regulator with XRE-family HTH domain